MNRFSARTPSRPVSVVSVAILLPSVAQSHHSQAYFSDEFTQMEGEIVELQWRNPHVKFSLRMENDAGEEELVGVETNSIYYLVRAGLRGTAFRSEIRVVVGGHESMIEGADFLAAEMVLADGDRVLLIRDGVTSQFEDVLEDTVADDRGNLPGLEHSAGQQARNAHAVDGVRSGGKRKVRSAR